MASSQILISSYGAKKPETGLRSDGSFRFSGDLYEATDKSVFSSLIDGLRDMDSTAEGGSSQAFFFADRRPGSNGG